jgi:hypothetical protein
MFAAPLRRDVAKHCQPLADLSTTSGSGTAFDTTALNDWHLCGVEHEDERGLAAASSRSGGGKPRSDGLRSAVGARSALHPARCSSPSRRRLQGFEHACLRPVGRCAQVESDESKGSPRCRCCKEAVAGKRSQGSMRRVRTPRDIPYSVKFLIFPATAPVP